LRLTFEIEREREQNSGKQHRQRQAVFRSRFPGPELRQLQNRNGQALRQFEVDLVLDCF